MMPYDENVNRFEAARKSFQWMERSKPSVAARGDVDLPSDSRRLFETGDLPEGIAVAPPARAGGRAPPRGGRPLGVPPKKGGGATARSCSVSKTGLINN